MDCGKNVRCVASSLMRIMVIARCTNREDLRPDSHPKSALGAQIKTNTPMHTVRILCDSDAFCTSAAVFALSHPVLFRLVRFGGEIGQHPSDSVSHPPQRPPFLPSTDPLLLCRAIRDG